MVMKAGEWSDTQINITASGRNEEGYRIYLVPEVFGEVILTGKVQITFAGSDIEVRGVWIDGISNDKITPVRFETGSNRCRFTNSAITNFNREVHDKKHHWIEAFGSYHIFDWNSFEEKVGTGQILRIKSPEDIDDQFPPGTPPESWGATIAYNYFGPREDTEEDDGEAIQIGLFVTEWQDFNSTVEFNYFYQYDGEIECISVKAENNIVRYNTFEESACTVTLRHGDNSKVIENYFFCNKKEGCGGVRIYGDNHHVINNYIEEENGGGARGGVVFQSGDDGPLHRPARNTLVEKNLIVDCDTCLYAGVYLVGDGGHIPENINYIENIMTAASSSRYVLRELQGQHNVHWNENIGYVGIIDNEDEYEYGLKRSDPELYYDSDWGIYRPGADGLDFSMTYPPLTRNDVGPTWKDLQVKK